MTHYLLTGGTGLIGSALTHQLLQNGHKVTILSRSKSKVQQMFGASVTAVTDLDDIPQQQVVDIIINLAGEPIADKHWTSSRKHQLIQSRVGTTENLINWIQHRNFKPKCLLSASAVGWYGNGGSELLYENSAYQQEFTHQLCEEWEQEALKARTAGVRVCIVRIGLVISASGGFLSKMLPAFKMGVGGRMGSGKQYMPWVHIQDICNLFLFLADHPNAEGIFNGSSPNPVTNLTFIKVLAECLHKPAFIPVPAFLLKILLGEMSRLLLTGQRTIPEKAQALGYQFQYTDLGSALTETLTN